MALFSTASFSFNQKRQARATSLFPSMNDFSDVAGSGSKSAATDSPRDKWVVDIFNPLPVGDGPF
jgi:hypothetical protein